MAPSPEAIEARALVMRTIASLKAKQAALDLNGLNSYVRGLILWLEDSVREFDARS